MFAAAYLAAAAIHLGAPPPPALQLAAAQREAPFRILVLPASTQLLRAEFARDAAGGMVRLEYSFEGAVIDVDERVPNALASVAGPPEVGQAFDLDGSPADYYESGNGYRHVVALTWYRPDLTVTLSSRDAVNAPMLVDVALELR